MCSIQFLVFILLCLSNEGIHALSLNMNGVCAVLFILFCLHTHYNVNFSPLLRQINLSDPAQAEEWTPCQSHCQKFYQVPITKDKVHFVDTAEALLKCQNIVLKVQRIKFFPKKKKKSFFCGADFSSPSHLSYPRMVL